MIQKQTYLNVSDNSGAKTVKCIGFLNKGKNHAKIGECIIVSVRSLARKANLKKNTAQASLKLSTSSKSTIQKGQVLKALIIRTKHGIRNRSYGHHLGFDSNDVVLLNSQDNLVGSRIFGPIPRELREKNYGKILSYADRLC